VCELLFGNSKRNAEKAEAAAKLAAAKSLPKPDEPPEPADADVPADEEQDWLFGTSGYHIGTASVALRHPAGTNPTTNFLAAAPHGIRGGGVQVSQGFMMGVKQSMDVIHERLAQMERTICSLSERLPAAERSEEDASP
jgi:hypothetical protein